MPISVPRGLDMPAGSLLQSGSASRVVPRDGESPVGEAIPACPNGIFRFAAGCSLVTDADEEVMELYMNLASTVDSSSNRSSYSDQGGLGFLDSTKSVIHIELELRPRYGLSTVPLDEMPALRPLKGNKAPRVPRHVRSTKVVHAEVQQDLGMLKQSKGDTGSVLWRSSFHLARFILSDHYFPPPCGSLLHSDRLSKARILELGSGTGLLAILLSPVVQEFIASDRIENLSLVRRNLEANGIIAPSSPSAPRRRLSDSSEVKRSIIGSRNSRKPPVTAPNGSAKSALLRPTEKRSCVSMEEIDWLEVSAERNRRNARLDPHCSTLDASQGSDHVPRIILAVDCVFNESLVQPLIDTFVRHCPPGGQTVVWVVMELRSSEVVILFLEKWIHDPSGPWTIVRVSEEVMGDWDGRKARWVSWVGWR